MTQAVTSGRADQLVGGVEDGIDSKLIGQPQRRRTVAIGDGDQARAGNVARDGPGQDGAHATRADQPDADRCGRHAYPSDIDSTVPIAAARSAASMTRSVWSESTGSTGTGPWPRTASRRSS